MSYGPPWYAPCYAVAVAALLAGGACGGESRSPSSPTPSTPTVTSIAPASGPNAGGTAVTITGTNFAPGARVTISGAAATNVQVPSATQITATTGAASAGAGDVVVTVGAQTGRLSGGFTYQAQVTSTLTFTVYNHTAGPLGTFTRTAQGGDDVTLQIANLGAQPAISVSGVDPQRIVVREGAQGGRIGSFVAFSNQGAVTFKAPWLPAARYDVFLMNNTPPCDTLPDRRLVGSYYHEVDSRWPTTLASRVRARAMTAFRPPDDGVVDAPDEPIDTAIKLYHGVVNYSWMSYGSYTRTEGSGDVSLQYGWWSWCDGHYSGWGGGGPGRLAGIRACMPNKNALWVGWQENHFQILLSLVHIDPTAGYADSHFVLARAGGYSPIGRDLIAYVYVRDPKGW